MKKSKTGVIFLTSFLLISLVFSTTVLAQQLFAPLEKDFLNRVGEVNGRVLERFDKINYIQDEIIVKFKGDTEAFRIIKVSNGKVFDEISKYRKRADVLYTEPNYIAHTLMVPNDSYYSYQWHLNNPNYGGINIEPAWDISVGEGATVAIIDTGIAYENYGSHCQASDFSQTCFVSGYDFVNNDSHSNDDNNHGTHVAGTVAQSTNNNLGVAGVAFKSCLMPVKVLDKYGSGSYANIAKGIRYAADNGAKVINLSLGGTASSDILRDAVKYAYEKGVTIVVACGNENKSSCLYPAAYDEYVIAVGATQYDETKAPYSSYGASLDIVAPGGNTNIDQNSDGYIDGVLQQTFASRTQLCNFAYYFFQGTSMAAPHISGVAALVISKGNAVTPDEVRNALQETAEDKGAAGRDNTYGYGLVNAYTALQWIAGSQPNKPPLSNAGPDKMVYLEDTVYFDGSGSSDPDGTIVSYEWDFGDGTTASGAAVSHIYGIVGSYTITLTVTDDDGLANQDTALVEIKEKPVAQLCWNGSYQYLFRNTNQVKKFCKCAQGTYGYNSYNYYWGRRTVYKYVDAGDNNNWEVALASSTAIYRITCTDGKTYLTNQDYYYNK